MKIFLFGLIGIIFLMGCCGPTTSVTSSSCPYGTYGDTCSLLCEKTGNTAFSDYPDSYCYETCLGFVKQSFNAHFSTCCTESAGQACSNMCNKQLNQFKQMYGADIMDETDEEFMEPCIGECTYFYSMYGINPNKICNIMDMSMIEESIYYGIYD
jgi:hypothetical protein